MGNETGPRAGPSDPPRAVRVLIVDDHESGRRALARFLEMSGFEVAVASDGAGALEALRTSPPEILLTDLRLPDLDGLEVAQQARQLAPAPRIGLITGFPPEAGPEDLARWGIAWVFLKPLDVRGIVSKLREEPGVGDRPGGRGQTS